MGQSEESKSVKLAKDKLLGFRHLASNDGQNLKPQAVELFTKRGEGPGADKTVQLLKGRLLGFRHLEAADNTNDLTSQADELFTKRLESPGGAPPRTVKSDGH